MGWPGPMTHRQYLCWEVWLDLEWNRPNRTDHYLASVATEVRRGNARKPRSVGLKHLMLKFKTPTKPVRRPLTEAEKKHATAMAKARWIGATGGKFEIRSAAP